MSGKKRREDKGLGNYRKQRADTKNKERLIVIKARLRSYKEDLILIEKIEDEIKEIKSSMYSLSSARSDTDAVQGGGTAQEDKVNQKIDKLDELERDLKLIKLENKALIKAIHSLPDSEMKGIVKKIWIDGTHTMRGLEIEYHMSRTTIRRRSDTALLFLYKKLYQEITEDVDPK